MVSAPPRPEIPKPEIPVPNPPRPISRQARLALLATTVLDNPWVKHDPNIVDGRSPQTEFLLSTEVEVLYGGSVGGGKSQALLMAAAQYVDIPGYNALLLRRTYQDLALPEAIMSRSREWWMGSNARWNENGKVWIFPSGATITFGYLQHESDKYQYQSAAFQFIGFDELTQFTESQYTYLFSRLRKSDDSIVPLRMRSASNPGGRGHNWVKSRFIVGSESTRRFIPATLADNPHINKETYIQSLMNLSPADRKQLLDGVWENDTSGKKFRRSWFKVVQDIPQGIRQVRCWDLAATPEIEGDSSSDPDYCAGVKGGVSKFGVFYITDVRRIRETPHAVEAFIQDTARRDGKSVKVYIEREPGASGKITISHFIRNVLKGFNATGIPRVSKLRKEERADPVSSKAEQGLVCVLEAPWNQDFFDELEQFPDGDHDDIVDAFVDVITKSESTQFRVWAG